MSELLKLATVKAFEALPEAMKEKDNQPGMIKVLGYGFIICVLLIAFAGVEAIKAIFRKNYGMNSQSVVRLLLSTILFLSGGVFSFFMVNSESSLATSIGSPDSHLVTGVVLSFMAIYILVNGLANLNQNHPEEAEGVTPLPDITYEPWVAFAVSLVFAYFNLLGGAIIFSCCLSVWLYPLIEHFEQKKPHARTVDINRSSGSKKSFEEVQV